MARFSALWLVVLLCTVACNHLDRIDDQKLHASDRCSIEIDAPLQDAVIRDNEDVDPKTDGLQIEVNVKVTGALCERIAIAENCPDSGDESGLSEQTEGYLATIDSVGNVSLCAAAFDTSGLVASTDTVEIERVACTDDDPEHCGETCRSCPDGDNARGACVDGACTFECEAEHYLEDGECVRRPGCFDLEWACGAGYDCCAVDLISEGGQPLTFRRGWDASNMAPEGVPGWQVQSKPAVTIDPFVIDRYEVTVARYRRFVAAYDNWVKGGVAPRHGAGQVPAIPDSGWRGEWQEPTATVTDTVLNRELPPVPRDANELRERISACGDAPTWSDEPSDNDDRPINCVNYWEAYLFCIWDHPGGRLPTEAEWNAAAAGGGQQRAFPWSIPPDDLTPPTDDEAFFGAADSAGPIPVGMTSGVGRWGTHDLAGNVFEWTRDTVANDQDGNEYVASSLNPLSLKDDANPDTSRMVRGGSYKCGESTSMPLQLLRTAARLGISAGARLGDVGFRCARSPSEN